MAEDQRHVGRRHRLDIEQRPGRPYFDLDERGEVLSSLDRSTDDGRAPNLGNAVYDIDGPLAGGHVGADWQWSWLVLGARVDAFWTDISGDDDGEDGALEVYEPNFIASLTGRTGAGFDRVHIYVLGGGAIEGYDYTYIDPPTGDSETHDATSFGPTIGAGAEVRVTQSISVFGEYRHYWFDGEELEFDGPETNRADLDLDLFHAGVNWRF